MIPLYKPYLPIEAQQAVNACLNSGWLGYGHVCKSLERRFSQVHGGWALATSSCTSALYIAGRLCKHSSRDEIIVPAVTYISTAMAFLSAGFNIRLADIDPNTLLLNKKSIEERLTSKTRAIVVVHLFGQRVMTSAIRELCDKHRIDLIEDCAHRLDLIDNKPHLCDYACYSFHAVKEAPGGEGGLIWTRNKELETRARAISNLGMGIDTLERSSNFKHGDYWFTEEIGLKYRLNDIAASLVNVSLNCLEDIRRRRMSIFKYYDERIKDFSPHIVPLVRNNDDSYLMYVIRLCGLDREKLRADMAEYGVATSVHYPSLTEHPLLANSLDYCLNADKASKQIVTLPCFPDLSTAEQDTVIAALRKAINNQIGSSYKRYATTCK
jgi:dTDP-4-amino-4,6-dideoxygalactose transaminase